MVNVVCTGIRKDTLNLIRDNLTITDAHFIEVSEKDFFNILTDKDFSKDALLLGEDLNNPVKLAQEILLHDKFVSILIINDPDILSTIKQDLQYTPYIGNTVQCIPNSVGINLSNVTEESIYKTKQRRDYNNLKSSTVNSLPSNSPPPFDSIRTEYLDKFLEKAPIGAILLHSDGKIHAINQFGTTIFNISEINLVGKEFTKLFPMVNQDELNHFITQENKNSIKKVFSRKSNESMQYLEISVADIGDNKYTSYKVLIVSDITDKILNERKINEHLNELEIVNKNLTKVNTDLDTFIYTASHDLKAPISNIEGLITILESEINNPNSNTNTSSIIGMIKHSINKFKETVSDLTEISKIQKYIVEEQELINFCEVINEVIYLINDLVISSNAEIITDCSNYEEIKFSKKNLKSIIYNLLSNAVKYASPHRKPQIEIRTERSKDGFVILTVKDNGLGIPENKINKIFSMFKRFHDHVEGTGIGLYIVKRIIDNTGGKIEVVSKLGKGTQFKIFIKQ